MSTTLSVRKGTVPSLTLGPALGAGWTLTVAFVHAEDGDGYSEGDPFDLSGWTWHAEFKRRREDSTPLASLTEGSGIDVTDAGDGVLTLSATADAVAKATTMPLVADLVGVRPGDIWPALELRLVPVALSKQAWADGQTEALGRATLDVDGSGDAPVVLAVTGTTGVASTTDARLDALGDGEVFVKGSDPVNLSEALAALALPDPADYPGLTTPVLSFDGDGNLVWIEAPEGAPADDTPPSAPVLSNITAGDGSVSFDVALPDEGETVMHVYRDTEAGATTLLESVTPAASYTDDTAENGTEYFYRVRLEDAAGNVSGYSNEVSATPEDPAAALMATISARAAEYHDAGAVAERTTLRCGLSGSWSDFVVAADGLVYGVPFSAPDILVIDPSESTPTVDDPSAERTTFGAPLMEGDAKWMGGALGSDGKIYCAPHDADEVLIIDPAGETLTLTDYGLDLSGSQSWWGAVASADGTRIYCPPYDNSGGVLVIDVVAGTASLETFGLTLSSLDKRFLGGCLGSDDKIYCPPGRYGAVLIIDPSGAGAGTATLEDYGIISASGAAKWASPARVGDTLYCAPHRSGNVLVIDTDAGTATTETYGLSFPTTFENFGAAEAVGDLVVMAPYRAADGVVIIDTDAGTAAIEDYGLSWSGPLWFTGVAVLADGRLIGVGRDNEHAFVLDPGAETGETTQFGLWGLGSTSPGTGGGNLTDGAVAAPDGKIYCPPRGERLGVLIIDPSEGRATWRTFGVDFSDLTSNGGQLWGYGGVCADDGKVYFCPRDAPDVLVIDTVAGTAERTDFGLAGMAASAKWRGGTLHPNGKAYFIPRDATDILVIDTVAGTAERTTFDRDATYLAGSNKWLGATVAPDGRIFAFPLQSRDFLVIDPSANGGAGSIERTTLGFDFSAYASDFRFCTSCCLGADGKVYGVPNELQGVMVVDPETDTATVDLMGLTAGDGGTSTEIGSAVNKWSGSVLGSDGNIYCIPFRFTGSGSGATDYILVIDAHTGTARLEDWGLSGLSGGGKWVGAANGVDGKIYCAPRESDDFLVITPTAPAWPEEVRLSPYVNKF